VEDLRLLLTVAMGDSTASASVPPSSCAPSPLSLAEATISSDWTVSCEDKDAPMMLTSGFLRALRFFLADGLRSSVLATDDDLADSTDLASPLPAVEADFLGRPT